MFNGLLPDRIHSIEKAVVHAFISSRLDYCNSLAYGISDSDFYKLRRTLQLAWSPIPLGVTTSPPVLQQLHWLPVRQRVEFKLVVVVYKALALQYLTDDCQLLTASQSSHVSFGRPRISSVLFSECDRVFPAAEPRLWSMEQSHRRRKHVAWAGKTTSPLFPSPFLFPSSPFPSSPFPSSSFPSPPILSFLFPSPSLPLEVGPLNLGSAVSSPQWGLG